MEGIVSQRYAVSLFEVAVEQNSQDEILSEIKAINESLSQNQDFSTLLSSPVIAKEEKKQMLDNVFADKVDVYVLNFMKILIDKSRMSHFDDITKHFIKLYNQKNNIKEVIAVTAVALNDRLLSKLKNKLEEITKKHIVLSNVVDESVLGGVILKMDDDQLDGSIKGRLDSLKNTMASLIA